MVEGKPLTASSGRPAQSSNRSLFSGWPCFLPAFVSGRGVGGDGQMITAKERAGWDWEWVWFLFTGPCSTKCVCSFFCTHILCVWNSDNIFSMRSPFKHTFNSLRVGPQHGSLSAALSNGIQFTAVTHTSEATGLVWPEVKKTFRCSIQQDDSWRFQYRID